MAFHTQQQHQQPYEPHHHQPRQQQSGARYAKADGADESRSFSPDAEAEGRAGAWSHGRRLISR